MFERFRRQWHEFRRARPGRRFVARYERRQENPASFFHAFATTALGALILVVGVVMIPGPGPGWLVTAIGLTLISESSRPVARFCDWSEMRLRNAFAWVRRRWRSRRRPAKSGHNTRP